MKKAFFLILSLAALTVSAQKTEKEIPMSVEFYDIINTIKKNPHFSFLQKHDKMIEVKDAQGNHLITKIVTDKYTVEWRSKYTLYIEYDGGRYFLNVINDYLLGHGFIDDVAINRYLTYYFQNEKIVYEGVIKHKKK